jgi:hypothetical protein
MDIDSGSSTSPFFSASRGETLLALAERVVPDEGERAPGAASQATLDAAETFVASQDETTRQKLRLLFHVFEWGAVLRFGKRFTRLPGVKQDAYLRAWEVSKLQLLRFGFSSLRNLVLISFYTHPDSWPMMNYPGPVLEPGPSKP